MAQKNPAEASSGPLSLEEIISLAKDIATKELGPRAAEVDEKGIWPERNLRALLKAGLGGLVLPDKVGGQGQGLLAVAKVCEALGKECASTAMCFGMHLVGSAVMSAKANEDQQKRLIVPIAKGEHLTTLSLSEPGTGSHFYIPQAKLETTENGDFVLNGVKSFVTSGGYADSYVVSTVSPEPGAPVGQFSIIALPKDSKGMSWGGAWEGLGMRGNSSRTLTLKDIKLPKENLLGEEGDQIWYVFEIVTPYFLMAMAGSYLGIATAALEETIEHLKERTYDHSGGALSHEPVVQHRLGELWADVERTRQILYSAAKRGDMNDPEAILSILSAKAEVADCATRVVNEAMTLMGGKAYGANGKLARHLRDARASHVMAPTTDILRTWTGRALLGLPLLGG